MDQRERFLHATQSGVLSVMALCKLHGISLETGEKWLRRAGLKGRSRRPRGNRNATPTKLVMLILSQKKQFPSWGPPKIRKRLLMHWPQHDWPAARTIGLILRRHGMAREWRRRPKGG